MARSRRRAHGEGSVFKRWDKALNRHQWMVQITLEDRKQKQYRVKSQEEGVRLLKKLQRELEQGTLVTGPKQTLEQYLIYWLEEVHKPTLKVSTYVKYRQLIKLHIIPALGHLTLDKLTPQHVKTFYNQKQKDGLKSKSIHNIHGVLHEALDNAVSWGYVSRNVCDLVKPPRLVKRERQSLTMEQAHRLLEVVRGNRLDMLLVLALTTGMRRGELLALRWSDVDMKARTLRIHRTVDYIAEFGYVENDPKSAASSRVIALPNFVVEMLQQHRLEQLEAKIRVGPAWQDMDLVFSGLKGGYFNPRYLNKLFHKVVIEAGLPPGVTLHSLRHSTATLLRSMNIDMKVIQQILGHSNFATTADIYSHVMPTMQQEAASKWDDEFHTS